jgi:cell wall assembly regulator SMI1
MKFETPEAKISISDLESIERDIGLTLPDDMKSMYLLSNGGSPDPYVYEDDRLDTIVSNFLPIKSSKGKRTAVDVYKHLVLQNKIVTCNFFPFAVDGGGDYFFVDCSTIDGNTYFFRSDALNDTSPLLSLDLGFRDFWSKLKPE